MDYILIFYIEGSGCIDVNRKKDFLNNNQYYIIPKLQRHTYEADNENPWSIYWIHFNGQQCPHLVNPINYPR